MHTALHRSVARITAPGGYCSGVLIAPDTVLTCAHFFRRARYGEVRVLIDDSLHTPAVILPARGTDIALVRLTEAIAATPLPIGPRPAPGAETVTFGFGGGASTPAARPGRYIGALPLALSRGGQTLVRPAGFIYCDPPAVKGDSGGPVLVDGRVVAVQSLILDPFGRNLQLATVSLLDGAGVDSLISCR